METDTSDKPLLAERAARLCALARAKADELGIRVSRAACGAAILDFGVDARGGLEAGRLLARICMADLGAVAYAPCDRALWPGPAVAVHTDAPLLACMASQYAGWKIASGKFFAMGSGPMRAAAAKEELFAKIGYRERPDEAIGVLETRRVPPDDVIEQVAAACGVAADKVTLCVAPTTSLAGTVQVVARSIETAMHKLSELKFDLSSVYCGWGTAPLPPPANDDIEAIGRTNDAILYGGEVTLWVRTTDDAVAEIGPKMPSDSSSDHGRAFAELFRKYDCDFYRMDPQLFSPAVVTFVNLDTGRTHRFGRLMHEVVERSFSG